MVNPFIVLGVPDGADPQTIRRAYKKLAVQHHPDRSDAPDAAERFKEVTEAYAVLTNEQERGRYARRRRQESAAREEYRRREAAAAQRRSTAPRSETATAAEKAFWEYARQVQERRRQSERRRPPPSRSAAAAPRWAEWASPLLATLMMAVYLWRSAHGLPLQPWLAANSFATHELTSPIWITLSLALLMIVQPRWFLIPIVMDEIKDVRLGGWALFLVCPLMSAVVLKGALLGILLPAGF